MSFSFEDVLTFKVVLIGDSGVGKTCLLTQFVDNKWINNPGITIGVDYGYKLININGQKVKLQIWDTAGQEKYRSLTRTYYRSANMAIIVYDITSKESFHSVERWILDVRETLCVPIMIIANKTDLSPEERVVTYQEGSNLAKRFNSQFWETSAKCKESTDYVFSLISKQLIKYNEEDLLPNNNKNRNKTDNMSNTLVVDENFDKTKVKIIKKRCC